jgi:hypothetical protein
MYNHVCRIEPSALEHTPDPVFVSNVPARLGNSEILEPEPQDWTHLCSLMTSYASPPNFSLNSLTAFLPIIPSSFSSICICLSLMTEYSLSSRSFSRFNHVLPASSSSDNRTWECTSNVTRARSSRRDSDSAHMRMKNRRTR